MLVKTLQMSMIIVWALAAGALAWYAASVASEVTYVTLADGRRQERSLPFVFKLLLPFVGNLDRLVSREFFAKQVETAHVMLVSAGFEGLLSGLEFVELKLLVPAVFGTLWAAFIFLLSGLLPGSVFSENALTLSLFGYAIFYLQPMLWLKGALKSRHFSIMRALPFVLDILTLSVEAGMDFISALQRNCASRKMDPLNEELLRMTKEIQVGSSRREALKRMSERVNQPDLRSVANALIQADELGVSIGAILRIQSEQLRSRRFDRAEKLANEAPTKMLGPLMFCIFPAVFIILLGPMLSQAMKGLL
ncbi:MAG: type II secretion system F family protein [Lentisphaerae bacterium]|jgi:tight adherence protein C|nr:type II secretion system F family protein [Lentisphaerota bacterium]